MDIINGACESLGRMISQMNDLGAVLGMRVLQPQYSMNTKEFKVVACCAILFGVATIYTVQVVSGDFVATIFCFATLGMYTQVILRSPFVNSNPSLYPL